MKKIEFEWDSKKDKLNKSKHGVSFEEAKSVFFDPNARLIDDPDHSETESRFILLGLSYSLKILIVCHCYKENDGLIRIISARKADKSETIQYRENLI